MSWYKTCSDEGDKLCGDTWDGRPDHGWDKDSLNRFAVAALLFHIILWRAILQKVILRVINHWRQGIGGSSGRGGRWGLLVIIRVPTRGLLLQHSNTQKENTFLFFMNERKKKTAVDWFQRLVPATLSSDIYIHPLFVYFLTLIFTCLFSCLYVCFACIFVWQQNRQSVTLKVSLVSLI